MCTIGEFSRQYASKKVEDTDSIQGMMGVFFEKELDGKFGGGSYKFFFLARLDK